MTATITRHGVGARMSEASVFQGVIRLAGMVPENSEGQGIEAQTQDVLAQIDKHLATCGSDKSRLLRVQIFLADLNDFPGMNSVWEQWVVAGHTPPRATVQALLAKPEWRLEMVVDAAQA